MGRTTDRWQTGARQENRRKQLPGRPAVNVNLTETLDFCGLTDIKCRAAYGEYIRPEPGLPFVIPFGFPVATLTSHNRKSDGSSLYGSLSSLTRVFAYMPTSGQYGSPEREQRALGVRSHFTKAVVGSMRVYGWNRCSMGARSYGETGLAAGAQMATCFLREW